MEITKQRAQNFWMIMKMRNAELHLKEATIIYGLQASCNRLQQDNSN